MKTHLRLALAFFCILLAFSACAQQPASSAQPSSTPSSALPPASSSSQQASSVSTVETPSVLLDIVQQAKLGKVLHCEYAINSVTIDEIEGAWGPADHNEYVDEAKGTYYTFDEKGLVFGANKGMLVFEIRSYAPELKEITYENVTSLLGKPEHTSTASDGQFVIGYTLAYEGDAAAAYAAPEELKIKFVFPSDSSTAPLNHYMVVDPTQTANSMADDSGREW